MTARFIVEVIEFVVSAAADVDADGEVERRRLVGEGGAVLLIDLLQDMKVSRLRGVEIVGTELRHVERVGGVHQLHDRLAVTALCDLRRICGAGIVAAVRRCSGLSRVGVVYIPRGRIV